jgi:YHS domain-containing protein
MKSFSMLLLGLGLALPVLAQSNKFLMNLDKQGLALHGYDPVAFFTDQKPVAGKAGLESAYHGGTYRFATAQHKAMFDAHPEKYEPAFGGYCAYGVSRNKLVDIDVNASQIVDGRLLLQYSKGVRDDFNRDAKGNLAKADANWPALAEKKGK